MLTPTDLLDSNWWLNAMSRAGWHYADTAAQQIASLQLQAGIYRQIIAELTGMDWQEVAELNPVDLAAALGVQIQENQP